MLKRAKLTSGEKATALEKALSGGGTLPRKSARKPAKVEEPSPQQLVAQASSSKSNALALYNKRKSCPALGARGGMSSSMAQFLTEDHFRKAFRPGDELTVAEKSREIKRLILCLSSLVKSPDSHLSNSEILSILSSLHFYVEFVDEENWNIVEQAILLSTLPKNCGSCFNSLESLVNEVLVHRPMYASSIANLLISRFVRPASRPPTNPLSEDGPSISELKCFDVCIKLMCRVIEIAGMKRLSRPLINMMTSSYPYVLKPTLTHFYYIRNLLAINKQVGNSMTYAVLSVIFHKMTQMDVLIPRNLLDSEKLESVVLPKREKTGSNNDANVNSFIIPEEEANDLVVEIIKSYLKVSNEVEQIQQIATLDIALSYLISFLSSIQETINFNSLLSIFESDILTTFNTNCVQFAFFYLINQKEEYLNAFLDFLWKKFLNVNTPSVIRILSIGYISGVLARSTKVDRRTLKRWISRLSAFAHEYLNSKSGSAASHWSNVNIHAHGPFYAVCQAIFYTFAFRHFEMVYGNMPLFKDETEKKKDKDNNAKPKLTLPQPSSSSFIYSLNLQRLITCDLNPLKACSVPVAKSFVDAAHAYQISYCKTVLERNNRANIRNVTYDNMREVSNNDNEGASVLNESFFPFDPLPLAYSKMIVDDYYRVYDKDSIALTLVSDALGTNNVVSRGRTRRDSRGVHNNEDDDSCDIDFDGEGDDEVDGDEILLASYE